MSFHKTEDTLMKLVTVEHKSFTKSDSVHPCYKMQEIS